MTVSYWIILGVVCLLAELMGPTFILFYFGIASLMVALLQWLMLIESFASQLMVFSLLSIGLLLSTRSVFKRWLKGDVHEEGSTDINDYSDVLENEFAVVIESFDGGVGAIDWRGSRWKAKLQDASLQLVVGDKVKVQRRDNLTVTVSAL